MTHDEAIAEAARAIVVAFSVPAVRLAEHAPLDLPCYCRPVTRAAGGVRARCPWWELAFGPAAEPATRPDGR